MEKGVIVRVHKQRGGAGPGDVTYYVRIPKVIYKALREPEAFELWLEGEKIVLKPLRERSK